MEVYPFFSSSLSSFIERRELRHRLVCISIESIYRQTFNYHKNLLFFVSNTLFEVDSLLMCQDFLHHPRMRDTPQQQQRRRRRI